MPDAIAVRTSFAFAVLGLGLGFVAIAWWSSNSAPESPVAAGTDAASPPSTVRRPPAKLPTELPRAATTPTANHIEEPLANEEAAVEPGVEPQPNHIERLMAAGFDADRAVHVVQRESELRVAAAYSEYAASGTVRPLTGSAQTASAAELRAELGDAEYERYLRALGQPTSVVVGSVEEASAAANAGLEPGDEIIAYAGQRVFNARDLSALTARRSPGETVAATVVRGGQTLQLYVTGGRLGLAPATR